MQQFTQKHTQIIAIAAISSSVLILLSGVVGAVAFRSHAQPKQVAEQQATPIPSSTIAPSTVPSPAPVESPQAQTEGGEIAASILVDRTALKLAPDANSPTVALFHQRQVVTVLGVEQTDGWYAVSAGELVGYVPANAISKPSVLSEQTKQYTPQPQESQGVAIQLSTQSL